MEVNLRDSHWGQKVPRILFWREEKKKEGKGKKEGKMVNKNAFSWVREWERCSTTMTNAPGNAVKREECFQKGRTGEFYRWGEWGGGGGGKKGGRGKGGGQEGGREEEDGRGRATFQLFDRQVIPPFFFFFFFFFLVSFFFFPLSFDRSFSKFFKSSPAPEWSPMAGGPCCKKGPANWRTLSYILSRGTETSKRQSLRF